MDLQLDWKLEEPEAVIKAREKKKGMNWFLEVLVFAAVFIVSSLLQILLMLPGELVLLGTNGDYQAALLAGDMAAANAELLRIAESDSYMLMSLFSTVAMSVVVIFFCRLLQKRRADTLGFVRKGVLREYLIGVGAGFGMFSAAVLICVAAGAIKLEGFSAAFGPGIFLLFVLGFMIQGMGEEVLCRGYFMVSMGRRYPMWAAVLSNSLIFAALHLLNDGISVLAFVNLVLFGVFASLYFIKRGSIWGIGALHSVWNLVQGNFWGLRVSGMAAECSVFRSTLTEGRELINGGTFGPEGGLAVSAVLAAGICLLLVCRKKETAGRQAP